MALDNAMAGELLEFSNGVYGMAQNLESNDVGIVILGDYTGIREGDTVKRTGRIMEVPVGDALLGRVVDSLGRPIDGLGEIKTDKTRPIERLKLQVLWSVRVLVCHFKQVLRLLMP